MIRSRCCAQVEKSRATWNLSLVVLFWLMKENQQVNEKRAFVVERRKKKKFHKFHKLCCVSYAINMIASVGRLSFVFCCRSLSDVSWWCCSEWAELSHWAHDTTCHLSTAQFTLTFNFSSFDQVHTVNIKFALKIAASWLMGECVLCSETRYSIFVHHSCYPSVPTSHKIRWRSR